MILEELLANQRDWSLKTFGPDKRTIGLTEHIKKELEEIKAKPDDVMEWIDVIILALDGYWRAGGTPGYIVQDLLYKQLKNSTRKWPPINSEDLPNEHIREGA